MFGYVSPHKCELKVKDLALYQAHYCGLCHALAQRYGQLPRLTLNYDCSFLALLLCGLSGGQKCAQRRCAYKPLAGEKPVAPCSPGMEYAADVNVLLAYSKLEDDWNDEKRLDAFAAKSALKRAADKAARFRPETAKAIGEQIRALSKLELEQCADIDAPADVFAVMMRRILSLYEAENDEIRLILGELGYHLGRWIYLIDAWDDREKDAKRRSYNPFLASGADEERASFLLYYSLREAQKAYDLLEPASNRPVLDNILYLGLSHKTESLLKGDER
ncbi:MAG: DUF5685 family protein [Bacillota bacterium]